jgi:hypothetical protein
MRKVLVSMLALIVAVALVFSARPALAQDVVLEAPLLGGAEEVPTPGDPDGYGGAGVTFASDTQVCFAIEAANITLPATAAHIHEGARGVAGPVVVPLAPPDASGKSSGCVEAEAALVTRIRENPAMFYVNVHTSDYPAGAIRGQLAVSSDGAPTTMPVTGANDGLLLGLATVALVAVASGLGLRMRGRRHFTVG